MRDRKFKRLRRVPGHFHPGKSLRMFLENLCPMCAAGKGGLHYDERIGRSSASTSSIQVRNEIYEGQ